MKLKIFCRLACFLPGRAKDLSAPLQFGKSVYIINNSVNNFIIDWNSYTCLNKRLY